MNEIESEDLCTHKYIILHNVQCIPGGAAVDAVLNVSSATLLFRAFAEATWI